MPTSPRSRRAIPSLDDIEVACASLEQLKRHLNRLVSAGGGEPSLALLTAAADDCAEAVLLCTKSAEIRMVNSAAARLTGYSTRELQSTTVWDITHATWQADFDVLWKEFLRAGRQRGVYGVRSRNGDAVTVAYCAEARVFGDFHIFVLRRTVAPPQL